MPPTMAHALPAATPCCRAVAARQCSMALELGGEDGHLTVLVRPRSPLPGGARRRWSGADEGDRDTKNTTSVGIDDKGVGVPT